MPSDSLHARTPLYVSQVRSTSDNWTVTKPRRPQLGTEVKVFDPRDFATGSDGAELLDASVVRRGNQWWMYLAGQLDGYGATDIYSASLPPTMPLSASGWRFSRDNGGKLAALASRNSSLTWDGKGGRHCPSYVKGWDPVNSAWVERIYYAGSADNLWGPYAIGFLEWKDDAWRDRPPFLRMRNGNTQACTSQTWSTTMANGRCGTWRAQTNKIIWSTVMRKAKTAVRGGANIRSLRRPR